MKELTEERGTFVVRVLNTQNGTWQGTVTWAETNKTVPFRSALELIRLIDSATAGAKGNGRRMEAAG